MSRCIKNGDGWRVGWNPQDDKYQGLVGTNDWAIELTQAEFADFQRLLNQLVATMKGMSAELMEEEKMLVQMHCIIHVKYAMCRIIPPRHQACPKSRAWAADEFFRGRLMIDEDFCRCITCTFSEMHNK